MKKVTIYDIAKAAGCSPATVSRVINRKGYVKSDTRRRVECAIREQGYSGAISPPSDVSGTAQIVGVLVPDIRYEHCAELIFYLEMELSAHGYSCIVCNANGDRKKALRDMELLLRKKVDGLILVNSFFAEKSISDWIRLHMPAQPIVMVYGGIDLPNVYSVMTDLQSASLRAVERFCERGKQHLAFIRAQKVSGSLWQQRALSNAAAKLGVSLLTVSIPRGSVECGSEIVPKLLSEHPLIDGMIFDSSLAAIGACRYCVNAAIPIPSRIGIIATDTLSCSEIVQPALTCADTKREIMAREAAKTMMLLLCGQECPKRLLLDVSTMLIRDTL